MLFSADKVEEQLLKVRGWNLKALGVVVNSPGGLPAQSDLICRKLKLFAKRRGIPLYTFAEDVAASGGYFVLCIGSLAVI